MARGTIRGGPYEISGPHRGKPLGRYPSNSSRLNADDKAMLGCAGCAVFAWLVYAVGFIAFWVIVALALLHYMGH